MSGDTDAIVLNNMFQCRNLHGGFKVTEQKEVVDQGSLQTHQWKQQAGIYKEEENLSYRACPPSGPR